MPAVPAPDGEPPRPAWQASLLTVAYLSAWVGLGFSLMVLALRAFA